MGAEAKYVLAEGSTDGPVIIPLLKKQVNRLTTVAEMLGKDTDQLRVENVAKGFGFGKVGRDECAAVPASESQRNIKAAEVEELLERIWHEQRIAWQDGKGVLAQTYLKRYPSLAENPEVAADVIYHEFIVREQLDNAPTFENFLKDYAPYASQLRELYQVDRLVKQSCAMNEPSDTAEERFGKYELLEKIGCGGMGVVYKARHISLDRIVAVKVLKTGRWAAEVERQRFYSEAEKSACLRHPNIVAVHDIGEHDGQPYFCMDYVSGESLAALTREKGLPIAKAVRYVELIARAIAYAHQCGIVHRDLKPSNVLVDTSGQLYITDFGLAKKLGNSPQLTMTAT